MEIDFSSFEVNGIDICADSKVSDLIDENAVLLNDDLDKKQLFLGSPTQNASIYEIRF